MLRHDPYQFIKIQADSSKNGWRNNTSCFVHAHKLLQVTKIMIICPLPDFAREILIILALQIPYIPKILV